MFKKTVSIFLAVLMLLSFGVPFASAQEVRASLVSAQENLQEKLAELLEEAGRILSSQDASYSAEALERLEIAMATGYAVYYGSADEQEVAAAVQELESAISAAKTPAVSDETLAYFMSALERAEALESHADTYTAESWAIFVQALEDARFVQANSNSEDEMISAANALEEAMNSLEEFDSEKEQAREYLASVLYDAYAMLSAPDKIYTAESYSNLEAAIETASAVYYDNSATASMLKEQASIYSLKPPSIDKALSSAR